jgi:DNA-binding NarL/FixJ family response regulator
MSIRIMIVDDHSVFRTGLRPVLDGRNDFEVVADVGSAAAALERAEAVHPDVMPMDIGLPGLNGLGATRELHRVAPLSAVATLTVLDDRASVWAAITAGAFGQLSKTAPLAEIERGIEAAAAGQFLLGSTAAVHIAVPAPESRKAPIGTLTLRESQLLRMLAAGRTTADMADRFGLSAKTGRKRHRQPGAR